MIRYDLDKLGWYEFEELTQTLLKASLGLGIEAWGGRKDNGRDAYYSGHLKYPSDTQEDGPFLFQCKFVEEANAAGANPQPLVLKAVRAECGEIRKRDWPEPPAFYTLLTNAILSPATRDEIIRLIKEVLPDASVISQGGKDICALLDLNPNVVRAFPQILGLRNLQDLLSERINADILARSETAIKEAEDLVRVFVPTASYYDALSKLGKHYFVILEGTPEMGKTTIGRIISLAKMNEGWSAIECRSSNDFLKSYRYEDKQIFFADDFFGRITYDPGRVSKWQDDLPHIFRKLDSTHWLIFTSRIHLLKIAKGSLDVSGLNDVFPELSEVTVDAGSLTEREKALILYRHAKNATFPDEVKNIIRREASKIISNSYFTPERINRLVRQVLLHEIQPNVDTLSPSRITQIIETSLSSPTVGMRRTFEAIPAAHKWLLFAMVEASSFGTPNLEDVRKRYEAICPKDDLQPFDLIIAALSEAFVNRSENGAEMGLYWMHPSAMDMVVEAFAQDERLRRHYLSHCSVQGIALATSIGGGARGARKIPLLLSEEDWRICAERAKDLLESGYAVLRVLFDNYRAILSLAKIQRLKCLRGSPGYSSMRL